MTITSPAVGDEATASWGGAVATQLNEGGFIGDAGNSATVTLATAAVDVAATASVTFTLTEQRRVRIITSCQYLMASGTSGKFRVSSAFNSGATPTPGAATSVGRIFAAVATSVNDLVSGSGEGTALLAPGTYTAYALVQRNAGGGATDTARSNYVAVYDCGNN